MSAIIAEFMRAFRETLERIARRHLIPRNVDDFNVKSRDLMALLFALYSTFGYPRPPTAQPRWFEYTKPIPIGLEAYAEYYGSASKFITIGLEKYAYLLPQAYRSMPIGLEKYALIPGYAEKSIPLGLELSASSVLLGYKSIPVGLLKSAVLVAVGAKSIPIGLAYEAVSPVSKTIPIGLVYSATLPPEALQSIPIELLKTAYSTLLAYNSIPVSLAYEVSVQLPGYYADWWAPFAFVSGETEDPKKPSTYLLEATHKTGKANMIPPSELYAISLAHVIEIHGVDDFDLDGVKEFVIGDVSDNSLSMYNASNGSVKWALLGITGPWYGCVADFNNDGKADRIIHSNGTSLECRKADGTLEWSVANVYYFARNNIIAFDIDGDGIVEIIVGNQNYMYMVHPDGSIERNVVINGSGLKWVWDFDADGSPELVTFYPGNLYCFTGVFGLKWNTATISPTYISYSSACKIDSDNIYELVICGYYMSTPAYLRCHKLSNGAALWSYDTAQRYANSNYLAFDIDGDGLGETVFTCSNGNYIICLSYNGTVKWTIGGYGRGAASVCDFNNDGYYEILFAASYPSGGVSRRIFVSRTGSVLWSADYGDGVDYAPSHAISNVYGDERVEVIAPSKDGVIRCWTSPA